jgi:hypothetical protein
MGMEPSRGQFFSNSASSYPYSPKCVEEEFWEVHLVQVAGFLGLLTIRPGWAIGSNSGGRKVAPRGFL